ncbi:PLP-dependent aminotransferase family protein [Mycobacterium sp. MYCO198283]|uniref:MocR-like transcription factor YczR n=1 Tax=Mycobacterium sp. MYCO198283 TaxID=2883505 RepID=UPI001E5B9731|nr:PLP-dependent aminotransferase family protein [Mycobacterium sp. MYCO198283]MCG5434353.1 PLP-dependent aminotransferase family protein [Mycobacterium sp. MYCO198283]
MTSYLDIRHVEVDTLVRALGNWRTAAAAGPVYRGLADALRLLIVDGRIPVGARLPSERALADGLRVSRTTVTAAYAQLRDEGYLHARRGARSTTMLPVGPAPAAPAAPATVNLAAAAMSASPAVAEAFADALRALPAHLDGPGHELAGVPVLREAIARRYDARGLPTDPDEVLVTTGALQAIGLIVRMYTTPGDQVLVEQPTYHGALAAIAASGARAVPVPMTDDGWDLDAMYATIRQVAPALAYLIPDNQNPTGVTMPAPDRERLGEIVAATRTPTVVDETMTDMWLTDPVPAPVAAAGRRHDLMLTVGSMSKSFWGGLRIGWIRGERSTVATLAALRPSVDMGTPIVEQLAAARLLAVADDVLPDRRALLRRRRDLLLSLLATHLPQWRPVAGGVTGGMSLWLRLPAPNSSALSAAASRLGLEIPPGPRFGVDGTLERFIRVPYTLPEPQLTEAVELLAHAWRTVTGSCGPQGRTLVV